jgi:hypothetical protein
LRGRWCERILNAHRPTEGKNDEIKVLNREQQRLRLHGSTVLRMISDSKEEEVKGGWRKLHNEEHNNLYSWPLLLEVIKSK